MTGGDIAILLMLAYLGFTIDRQAHRILVELRKLNKRKDGGV